MQSRQKLQPLLRAETLTQSLHLMILFNLALAQPLYDVTSKQAEFYVAHETPTAWLVFGTLLLSICLPGLLSLFPSLLGIFSPRLENSSRFALVVLLSALFVLPVLNRSTDLSVTLFIASGALFGMIVGLTYVRSRIFRMFLTCLSPGIVVFPLVFLFFSPVSQLVFSGEDEIPTAEIARVKAPVFVIVFDEFSTVSLLNRDLQIDERLYPNFAQLAAGSYWFRNATTVSLETTRAVSAIVSGTFPKPDTVPTASNYPVNLFSLFARSHEVVGFETVTELCPETICRSPLTFRVGALVSDLCVLFTHMVAPAAYRKRLSSIADRWTGFMDPSRDTQKYLLGPHRERYFQDFLDSIPEKTEASLRFIHILLPHVPYQYLPDGRLYTVDSYLPPWGKNEVLAAQAYQRYLLQVGFTDRILGQFLERLRQTGIYDDALIVVTADHGASFEPGDVRRSLKEGSLAESLGVPLFIKKPRQRRGEVTDANIEIIDILPTIAYLMDLPLAGNLDGASAIDARQAPRLLKRSMGWGASEIFSFSPDLTEGMRKAVERRLALFDSSEGIPNLYTLAMAQQWVDRPAGELAPRAAADVSLQVENLHRYHSVNPKGQFLPAMLKGTLSPGKSHTQPQVLVLALNGTISGVTRTYSPGGSQPFYMMLSPHHLKSGSNRLDFYLLQELLGKSVLVPVSVPPEAYSLEGTLDSRVLRLGDQRYPLSTERLIGGVSLIEEAAGFVQVGGWAGDAAAGKPVDAVIVFASDRYIHETTTFHKRPDVAGIYGKGFLYSGFNPFIPRELFGPTNLDEIRVFALFDNGEFSELPLP